MAFQFHKLKVASVIKETDSCISVSFDIPEETKEAFAFTEGQNLTLKKDLDGEELRRSYSICTAPHEGQLKVAIKKVPGGKFSTWAYDNLKSGDSLQVMPASGNFTLKNKKETGGNYLAIAAGSGITPVISIIKQTLHTQPASEFTLIYGNQSHASIIFFEELEALKNKFMGRFRLINILSRERTDIDLHNGRIDEEKLTALSKIIDFAEFDDIFICGPEAMIFSAESFLLNKEVAKNKIHFELFTTPGQKAILKTQPEEVEDDGNKSEISIKLDGRSFSFNLGAAEENILNAALKQGADLPFACKAGVCCTCKAKLISGKVTMDVNYALEEEEVEQGYILTCQSHPASEKVVIDFDVK